MKEKIDKLRDYAELAQASYFYFDLKGYILQENETIVILNELVNLSYNGKIAGKKEKVGQEYSFIGKGELNGEFGELQARNFSQRYEVKFHQPNTLSGFSATLFGEKRKQIDSKTKEKIYTSEYGYINYILAIRGIEPKEVK
ncbi:TPA: hypothetical protein R8T64_001530 [Campylobacter lari]|nr:hypothetical protein [Campylobacter lari]